MKRYLPLFCIIAVFLFFKIFNLSIRLSDTNIYFYTAYQILKGEILYKDLFFTNFPLFPYISSLYLLLLQGNLPWFYFTAPIEATTVAIILVSIIYKKTKDDIVTCLSVFLYLFSFIVLSTSDHQTGVFLASLFMVLSYFFFDKKNFLPAGVFAAFSIVTKAYFIAIPLSFFLYLLLQKQYRPLLQFTISGSIAAFLILSPFLVFAQKELLNDVFSYSLTRGAGTVKQEVVWFFFLHDPILFAVFIYNFFTWKKNLLFTLISSCSLLFFLFYQDIYYLYLNFAIPFLLLSFPYFYYFLQEKIPVQKAMIPTTLIFIASIGIITYFSSYIDLQKPQSMETIIQAITKEKPAYLYGTNDIAPALAYLTHTPLVNNIIDTNENIFRKNYLNATTLTKNAISQNAMLISHGAFYPGIGIQEDLLDGIFDKALVAKHCTLLNRFPVKAEGNINTINLFKCY